MLIDIVKKINESRQDAIDIVYGVFDKDAVIIDNRLKLKTELLTIPEHISLLDGDNLVMIKSNKGQSYTVIGVTSKNNVFRNEIMADYKNGKFYVSDKQVPNVKIPKHINLTAEPPVTSGYLKRYNDSYILLGVF